jgi:hypothetical protein
VNEEYRVVSPTSKPLSGARLNKSKPMLSLVPKAVLEAMAEGLEFGMHKYDRNNWRKGLPMMETMDSLLRHLADYADPDEPNIDAESGIHTLHLAACNIAFLCHGLKHGWPELREKELQAEAVDTDTAL